MIIELRIYERNSGKILDLPENWITVFYKYADIVCATFYSFHSTFSMENLVVNILVKIQIILIWVYTIIKFHVSIICFVFEQNQHFF